MDSNSNQMFNALTDNVTFLTSIISKLSEVPNPQIHNTDWCKQFKFDGKPSDFQNWVKLINKRALEINLPDKQRYVLALQSSKGSVSDFICRYLENNSSPNSWTGLYEELKNRFSYTYYLERANIKLSNCKQGPNETAAQFCERIIELAHITDDQQINSEETQTRLKTIFLNGLINQELLNLVKVTSPKTLDEALLAVKKFENYTDYDSETDVNSEKQNSKTLSDVKSEKQNSKALLGKNNEIQNSKTMSDVQVAHISGYTNLNVRKKPERYHYKYSRKNKQNNVSRKNEQIHKTRYNVNIAGHPNSC